MSEDAAMQALFERFPSGIFVVALPASDNCILGIVATWVMQVSFEPPLVAVSVETGGVMAEELRRSGRFSLNLVQTGDIATAKTILKYGPRLEEQEGREVFAASGEGLPVLGKSAGVLICKIAQIVEAGDHLLVVAEAVRGESPGTSEMLTLRETGWKYRNKTKSKPK